MMDRTDRHCRYFHRLLSRHVLLYTEMVTTGAILHGNADRMLGFHPSEHPLALQLGGSDPGELAKCAQIAEERGFDEVNLNCGCPSDRVQKGAFGARLMREPGLVADCVRAMVQACDLPVTVKCRIGVDDQDDYTDLQRFTEGIAQAGCRSICVHARKAWLNGVSPKENRNLPPLNYGRVYQLKQDFPHMEVVMNGGIENLEQAREHLEQVDGVMLGRAAYQAPWMLAAVDTEFFGDEPRFSSPLTVLDALIPYVEQQLARGERLHAISRHILGLFHGIPGTRRFKHLLSQDVHTPDAGVDTLLSATEHWREECVGA